MATFLATIGHQRFQMVAWRVAISYYNRGVTAGLVQKRDSVEQTDNLEVVVDHNFYRHK